MKITSHIHSIASRFISKISIGTSASTIIHLLVILLMMVEIPSIRTKPKDTPVYIIAPVADKVNIPNQHKQSTESSKQPKQTPAAAAKKSLSKKPAAKVSNKKQPASANKPSTTNKTSQNNAATKKPSQTTAAPIPKNSAKASKPKAPTQQSSSSSATKNSTTKAKDRATKSQTSGTSALKSIDPHSSNQKTKLTKNTRAHNDNIQNLMDELDDNEYDQDSPLSTTELNLIMSQIRRAWNVTSFSGAADAKKITVTLTVKLNIAGNVISITHPTNYKLSYNKTYNAMLKSSIRAVHDAAPFRNLPKNKYHTWKTLEILFDPTEML